MALEQILKNVGSKIKQAAMIPLVAMLSYMPLTGKAAQVIQNPGDMGQDNTKTELFFDMVNNDMGTEYESAKIKLDVLVGNIASNIIARNSTYSTNTITDVCGKFNYYARGPPDAPVYDGWLQLINGNYLDISNVGGIPGIDYIPWLDSYNYPDQDKMRIFVDIPSSMLDYNHDGTPDVMIELSTNAVTNAFVADFAGFPIPTTIKSYQIKQFNWAVNSKYTNGVDGLVISPGTTKFTQGSTATQNVSKTVLNLGDGKRAVYKGYTNQ